MTVSDRLAAVRGRIEAAARRAGRDPDEVTLAAISKAFPIDALVAALDVGAGVLGENRAQELKEKAAVLGDRPGLRWHFVGHLQTNKVRAVVGTAALIHSVDRFGVAEAIARRARALGIVQDVLLEVNLSGEKSKHGVEPGRLPALAGEVEGLEGIRIVGLMTMPPFPADPEDSRPFFKDLAALGADLAGSLPAATHLSMGMTRDFEVAIEEGATIVRVGEAIFGPRRRAAED